MLGGDRGDTPLARVGGGGGHPPPTCSVSDARLECMLVEAEISDIGDMIVVASLIPFPELLEARTLAGAAEMAALGCRPLLKT